MWGLDLEERQPPYKLSQRCYISGEKNKQTAVAISFTTERWHKAPASPFYQWANWGLMTSNHTQASFGGIVVWTEPRAGCGQCLALMSDWKESVVDIREWPRLKFQLPWWVNFSKLLIFPKLCFSLLSDKDSGNLSGKFNYSSYAYRGHIMYQALIL